MVVVLTGLVVANPAHADDEPPLPKPAPPVTVVNTAGATESSSQSQVFPGGLFPTFPAAGNSSIQGALVIPQSPVVGPVAPSADLGSPGFRQREPQEGPAVPEYSPISAVLPDYYYQFSYYYRYGGPVGGPEYAPPGYEAREYQDAPGVPEFMAFYPPAPITPEERQKFVTRGIVPGSFLAPGTNTSFRIRGFVRMTGIYDYKPIGSPDIFVTNTIPVPQMSGQNANATARPSRIATETWTPTSFLDWSVHTFIEADFFNGQGQAPGGGGNPFRLRHAFVDYGYFRVGQQNSVFMDGGTWPSLVDFQGPAGWVNQRRPGARVMLPVWDNLIWTTGIEQPFSDITTNGLGTNVQYVPDFASNLRYEIGFGHVQVAGLGRSIGFQATNGDVTQRPAYGVSTSTTFHPWAMLIGNNPLLQDNATGLERCRIIGQYTFGRGIGRYMLDTVGLGLDGQVNPYTGGFETPFASGWLVSYEHWFNEKWMAQGTWSETQVNSNGGQPGTTYTGARYVAASLWYIPFRNMSLGIEQLFGERENLDGQRGRAQRLNGLVQYNF